MASRRRRRRRSWSSRLQSRLIQHRTSGVRFALGVCLLAGLWSLWPEPGYRTVDQLSLRGAEQQFRAGTALRDGLVGAAQASVAVSAKQQLAGDAAALQWRLRQRLRQVARTMPPIGIPQQLPANEQPKVAAVPGDLPPAVAAADAHGERARPDLLPENTAIARAGRAAAPHRAAPATAAAPSEPIPEAVASDRAQAVPEPPPADPASANVATAPAPPEREPASAEVSTDLAAIMPAAPPPAPEPPAPRPDRQTVAFLDLPADLMAREPGQRRTPAWLRNAVPTTADTRPAVAVVIDDLGLNRRGTAALNRLRAPLTLSFLPYATHLDEQTRAARAAGHELMVHVPMEPRSHHEWPGPNALTAQLGPAELIAQLRSQLRSFGGFVGINNHMGSLLTADPARMALVMAELRQRELLFLDSRTTSDSVAARTAERMHVPFTERDVFIDNELDLQYVLRALAQAEQIARHRGHAVAMGHPHDVTIEALKRWLPGLDDRGIALVPISAIVARESCASGLILVGDACTRYAVAQSAVR
jgi:hypothetical protein